MKLLMKRLRASRRRQARMRMPRRLRNEQLDKASSKIGVARKSRMKKRRKRLIGERKNQVEVQWAEDEKFEESLERRRMEGSFLQLDVMHEVPESVVHERMSQGEG